MSDRYPHCTEYLQNVAKHFHALQTHAPLVERAAKILADVMRQNNKIMFCGNGGSAADAQHLAAELMGRYLRDRSPLPAIALTVDTSVLTAIGNDYSFEDVFVRQLRGLGRRGDALVAISTSGNSENVMRAVEAAKALGIITIGLTGQSGGRLRDACDTCICVPATQTNHIQEMHIAVGHYLCGYIEHEVT